MLFDINEKEPNVIPVSSLASTGPAIPSADCLRSEPVHQNSPASPTSSVGSIASRTCGVGVDKSLTFK